MVIPLRPFSDSDHTCLQQELSVSVCLIVFHDSYVVAAGARPEHVNGEGASPGPHLHQSLENPQEHKTAGMGMSASGKPSSRQQQAEFHQRKLVSDRLTGSSPSADGHALSDASETGAVTANADWKAASQQQHQLNAQTVSSSHAEQQVPGPAHPGGDVQNDLKRQTSRHQPQQSSRQGMPSALCPETYSNTLRALK